MKMQKLEAKSNRLRERYEQQYREANQTVKRKARTDKRKFMESLANEAEEAASKGEQGKVYRITRMICGGYRGTTDAPIFNKQGQLLTAETEQEGR